MTDIMVPLDEVAELRAAISELTGTVRGLQAALEPRSAGSRIVVRSEPMTYRPDLPVSYFRDLVFRDSDPEARLRLARHAAEWDDRLQRRDRDAHAALAWLGAEYRITPGALVQGDGGYFAPPLWMIDKFATAPRTGRILAALIPSFPLPRGVHSINLPRLTTGTTANGSPDNTAVPSQDVIDAAVDGTVVMVSGSSDWPLQALEQSPPGAYLDSVVFKDLGEAFDYSYEQQLIYGAGANSATDATGQLLGIIRASSANKITYTSGSPTLTGMYGSIGQIGAQIGDNRKKPPECWLMTTSRWFWITTSEDSQQRPITPPDTSAPPPLPADGPSVVPGAVGTLAARTPVYLDDAIPTTFSGGNTSPGGGQQDVIIACRPTDMLLLEGPPTTMVTRETLSGTMGVRFIFRQSVSAMTQRYPMGCGFLVGTGMTVQAGF